MTKKNLKPQQAAPVQREINTTSSVGGTGLTPLYTGYTPQVYPFAGDDAE
jgi:prenylated cyclic peptide (anacyclamide/piricyclamide family)